MNLLPGPTGNNSVHESSEDRVELLGEFVTSTAPQAHLADVVGIRALDELLVARLQHEVLVDDGVPPHVRLLQLPAPRGIARIGGIHLGQEAESEPVEVWPQRAVMGIPGIELPILDEQAGQRPRRCPPTAACAFVNSSSSICDWVFQCWSALEAMDGSEGSIRHPHHVCLPAPGHAARRRRGEALEFNLMRALKVQVRRRRLVLGILAAKAELDAGQAIAEDDLWVRLRAIR
jgi:hypothetical protein